MARTGAEAQLKGRVWILRLGNGLHNRLRVGGYFAGHASKEDLKKELRRQFWKQEQEREDGENVGHYLQPQTSGSLSGGHSASADTDPIVVKDVKVGRRRKASRNVPSPDEDQHASSLPVSSSTRLAEKRSKLEAAAKRKLAAVKKKQKLAKDYQLSASRNRRAVTRSRSTR